MMSLSAIIILLVSQTVWGVVVETTTPSGASRTIVISKNPPPPPPKNFFVCYQRMTRYVTKNVNIERCNPYGMCRNVIIPVKRKVIRFTNCQINTQGCYGSLSKFGWYPSGKQAKNALGACQNQPVIIVKQ